MKAMRIIAAVTLGLAIAMAACGGGATAAGPVAQAQADFEAGNYDGVQKACDRIMADSADFAVLDVAQLCTLAELYIRLDSARMDAGEAVVEPNEASAVRCLGRARTRCRLGRCLYRQSSARSCLKACRHQYCKYISRHSS